VKLLLADPRSAVCLRRSSQLDSNVVVTALLQVISHLENFLGKFKNLKLRLFQEDCHFSGIYIDGKLR
jgi:hypothetical protein